jgi:hypothetical protein
LHARWQAASDRRAGNCDAAIKTGAGGNPSLGKFSTCQGLRKPLCRHGIQAGKTMGRQAPAWRFWGV